MKVQTDEMSAPSSWERAQRLHEKNLELENKCRRSARVRVPSDPNAWQQMRENYEAIILEDHAFSEQHNIEYALWQLHYKRIEEFRAYFNAALSSASSNPSQGGKGPLRPDRISKIRLQFKTFLSEATGFYHDHIMKIRANYGLPLGYFEDSETQIALEKDGKKYAGMRQGLLSCHQCLIYLGDLARYKGMYGEGDSTNREFTAASSYYLQAASLWPSSGNPHHQLALLASYSGEELVTIYRYFRSLAVDSPFTTARENLIVAFEKNRQSYTQLLGDAKALAVKESSRRLTGKGRRKVEAKLITRVTGVDASPKTERPSSKQEIYKYFCTRFVRLNGILFTRTSLETFTDVLAVASSGLRELLSPGLDEELSFGTDAAEDRLAIVRIVCIIVFTVYNVNKESEGQSYAEIVQRDILLQNACAAAFELMGYIIERCAELRDPSSSTLLPGILVFVEWLACYPDFAKGDDADDNRATLISKFWNHCMSLLNKLLSDGSMSIVDEEETCFSNMTRYEEGETENRLALWEDFELRGFIPLLPAQTILDFSRKYSLGSDTDKERKARVKRIIAAGKALANVVRVDKKMIIFDSKEKKFTVGVEPLTPDDFVLATCSGMLNAEGLPQENSEDKSQVEIVQSNQHQYMEGDEDDEVIVFKPIVSELRADGVISSWTPHVLLEPARKAPGVDLKVHVNSTSNLLNNLNHQTLPVSVSGMMMPQNLQPVQPQKTTWVEEEVSLANNLKGLGLFENGHTMKPGLQEAVGLSNNVALPFPIQPSVAADTTDIFYGHSKDSESLIPSKADAIATHGVITDYLSGKTTSAMQPGFRKTPVSRPTRHLEPPPGFSYFLKQGIDDSSVSDSVSRNPVMDDYGWLDGYQLYSSTKGLGPLSYSQSNSQQVSNNGLSGISFPFPGKQVPSGPLQVEKRNGWQEYQTHELLRSHHDQQQQQLTNGNQQFAPLPKQFQEQSIWTGRYFV